jgi:hypothetical protein
MGFRSIGHQGSGTRCRHDDWNLVPLPGWDPTQTELLVTEATVENPNKSLLQAFSDGIKGTAGFLKDAVPAVATISTQIIALIGKIHGIGL